MNVIKRDGSIVPFEFEKIKNAVNKAFNSVYKADAPDDFINYLETVSKTFDVDQTVEDIQKFVIYSLGEFKYYDVQISYIKYKDKHDSVRNWVEEKKNFINKYKQSFNTADSTIDDNSNVGGKNVGILNAEIHKPDNIQISRRMIMDKLKELYPDFDSKQYVRDLEHHIIYKHDESSFAGAIAPYCCSISMYPFLTDGIKNLGGLSAAPKNLDSFCGMYINLIFATASMFAGAVATSEFLLYFDYFARKEFGDDYYLNPDLVISQNTSRHKSIRNQIHQYFQQVIYSINQPAASRGQQSAFVNFSYFDKPFFDGMFGDFYFPDNTQAKWESVCWLQKEFMQWFNKERLRCILTFPVESVTLLYKDGEFADEDMFNFVCEEYARGHSFFTYISDTVDSLSSCCRLKNKIQTKEFNFTNGNMGVMTGSKSVITLNLNRIVQNWCRSMIPDFKMDYSKSGNEFDEFERDTAQFTGRICKGLRKQENEFINDFKEYFINILERVYKYHTAYNEGLWDMYNAGLLPVYSAGFISLDKQYLTIGLNGLNQAAEFLGIECNDNEEYKQFCQLIFSTVKEQNTLHKTKKTTYNTEMVPAESLAVKNYNWDKQDGYWVPEDTNLYASYVFKPNDSNISVLEKLCLHGSNYIGDYLDGGSAAHINLDSHLSAEQYHKLIKYAASVGCQYFTWNIPNSECQDCGWIGKQPVTKCPKCGSEHIDLYDRVIGYLTKVKNWSDGRRIEQKTRVYTKENEIKC